MVVLDASFSIPLFISDPRSPQALTVVQQLKGAGHSFLAPTLWIYEVTSTIRKLHHFGSLNPTEVEFAIDSMLAFEIEFIQPDGELVKRAMAWSQRLKRASAYDSFYLALAAERGCDLWTADVHLSNAMQQSWVRLLA
jgi:predicted nucleic acid-binding protein